MHIVSNASTLYPDEATGSLGRRYSEWLRKKFLQSATTLIVPDIQIGRELVELYDIDEEMIEIIPHLPLRTLSGDTTPIQRIDTPVPYFLYDGGYAGESNILTLLAAWEHYRRDGGRYDLLLLGPALSHLSLLTHMIRSLDLANSVRYLGYLDDATLATLYTEAKGWIYVWPYYSAGQLIELARAYALPMLLSDIRPLREYDGIKVHPNHTTDIAEGIRRLERTLFTDTHPHHIESYVEAYEKILMRKK
jgi:glycosyltransferase involved in cell wall biosynthesis